MYPWKVIYVNSRAERKVAERLLAEGIEAYVPLKKDLKQWSDRKKMVTVPLINGYVFVRPSAVQRDQVLQIVGALQYVRFNAADAVVRAIEIEMLRSIEEKGYFVELSNFDSISTGDKVQIQQGPFKGIYGEVLHKNDRDIYRLEVTGINYSLKLELPSEVLEKT